MRRSALVALALSLLLPSPLRADDVTGDDIVVVPGGTPWDMIEDPVIRNMMKLDAIAPFEDLAPLWDAVDPKLQKEVMAALARLGLDDDARRKKLAVAFVDLSVKGRPRVAAVNGDTMMYAASLPKIAVLLAAFEKIAQGKMEYSDENKALMKAMIRRSNNYSTTELMHRVGKQFIARVLLSPRYRLYDPRRNGGLWVGKDYAKSGLWKRDPLHNQSHGATAMQVARFYYLLHTENFVTPEYSREMRAVMSSESGEHIGHKFVKALNVVNPASRFFRKSGSWRTFHSDSVLVERGGKGYIAVALSDHPDGSYWMVQLIIELDHIVYPETPKPKVARKPK